MLDKEVLSIISIVMMIPTFLVYFYGICVNKYNVHHISWAIWTVTTFVAFVAQFLNGGGAGDWPTAVSFVISFIITLTAYFKRGKSKSTNINKAIIFIVLLLISMWFFTRTLLLSLVILTLIDVVGFIPTILRAYRNPFKESSLFYSLFAIRNFLAILALEHYSVTTVLFPSALIISSAILVLLVKYRQLTIATLYTTKK